MSMLLPGEEPGPAPGLSIGRRRDGTLSGSRPCPHLAATDGRPLPYTHASNRHVCNAQPHRAWKGFRRVNVPHAPVTRDKQKQHCLADFTACEFYLPPAELGEGAAPPAPRKSRPAPAAAPKGPRGPEVRRGAPRERPARPRRRRRKHAAAPGQGWSTTAQLSALGALAAVVAFAISLFFSPAASSLYGKLALMFLKSNAGSLGISAESIERAEEAGLLNPANLGQLKNLKDLPPSQRNKLQSSDAFKNLSEAEKARLKRAIQDR